MADNEITNVLRITGIDTVATAFRQLGDAGAKAFDSLSKSAEKVGPAVDKASAPVKKLEGDVKRLEGAASSAAAANDNLAQSVSRFGGAAQAASSATGTFITALSTIAKTAGVIGASLTAAGTAMFVFAKSTADTVNATVKSAEAAKQSTASYQQMVLSLKQMGLSQKEAEQAVSNFTAALKKTSDEGAIALKKLGVSFPPTEEGARSLQEAIARLPVVAGNFKTFAFGFQQVSTESEKLREVLSRLNFEVPKTSDAAKNMADVLLGLTGTEKSTEALAALTQIMGPLGARFPGTAEGAAKLAEELLRLNSGAATFVTSAANMQGAFSPVNVLIAQGAKAFADFATSRDQGVRGLAAFADALKQVKDPSLQATVAQKAFTEELGNKLLPTLRKGSAEVLKFSDDFKRLGLGFTADNISNAKEFTDAIKGFKTELERLGAVSEKGRVNLGSLFQPIFTPLIKAATEALRDFTNASAQGEGILVKFGRAIATVVEPAIKALAGALPSISKALSDPNIGQGLGEGLVNVGKSIVSVVKGVIIPAFDGLVKAAQFAAEAINNVFGTKFTASDIGLAAVITTLIGGFKSLAVAALALFTGVGPGFDQFREGLKRIGIDIAALRNIIVGFTQQTLEDLKAAFSGRESDVAQGWILQLKEALTSLPAIVVTVIAAFLLLRNALGGVATLITQVFKVPVSAAGVGLAALVLQLTGILPILTALLIGAAAASTLLLNTFRLFSGALVGIAALIGWPAVLIAGIAALIVSFNDLKGVAEGVARVLNLMLGTDLSGGQVLAGTIIALTALLLKFSGAIGTVSSAFAAGGLAAGIGALIATLGRLTLAITVAVLAFEALRTVMGFNQEFNQFREEFDKLNEAFAKGPKTAEAARQHQKAIQELTEKYKNLTPEIRKANEEANKQKGGVLAGVTKEAEELAQKYAEMGARAGEAFQKGIRGASQLTSEVAKSGQEAVATAQKMKLIKVGEGTGGIAEQIRKSTSAVDALKKKQEETTAAAARLTEAWGFGTEKAEELAKAINEIKPPEQGLKPLLEDFGDMTARLDELKSFGDTALDGLKSDGEGAFQPAESAAQKFLRSLQDIGTKAGKFFQDLFSVGKAGAATGGGDAEHQAAQMTLPFQIAAQRIKGIFEEVQKTLAAGFKLPEVSTEALTKPFEDAANRIKELMEQIRESVSVGFNVTAPDTSPFTQAFENAKTEVLRVLDEIKAALAERLSLPAPDVETFRGAVEQIKGSIVELRSNLLNIFQGLDTGALSNLTASLTQLTNINLSPLAASFVTITVAAQTMGAAVGASFGQLGASVQAVVASIAALGPSISLASITLTTAFGQITLAVQTMAVAVQAGLAPLTSGIFLQIATAATTAFNQVAVAAQTMASAVQGSLQQIASATTNITSVANQIGSAFSSAGSFAASSLQQLVNILQQVSNGLQQVVSAGQGINQIASFAEQAAAAMRNLEAAARQAAAAIRDANQASSGGGGGGFSGGGKLRGGGTPTSDSIPIWGSRDEWMIRARSAKYYGDRLMALINAGRIPREALIKALHLGRGFSMGGAISGMKVSLPRFDAPSIVMPAMAGGGPLREVVVDLKVGGQSVGTVATTEDTLNRLQRLSTHAKIVATGAYPNWRR